MKRVADTPQRLQLTRQPTAYTMAELDAACHIAAQLNRGVFYLGPPLPRVRQLEDEE